MAAYRCDTHQTSLCGMKDNKFSTPNSLIISKNKHLFHKLAMSVSAKNFKNTKRPQGDPKMADGVRKWSNDNFSNLKSKMATKGPQNS